MHKHGTKTTPVFLPTDDGEASWSLLPSSVSLLSGGTAAQCNQKTPIPVILKVTCQVWEKSKKDKHHTNHSYHQGSSP